MSTGTAVGVGPASVAPPLASLPSISSTTTSGATNRSVVSSIANSEAATAVSNRIKDIRGHEYMLMALLVPVLLYYAIGG